MVVVCNALSNEFSFVLSAATEQLGKEFIRRERSDRTRCENAMSDASSPQTTTSATTTQQASIPPANGSHAVPSAVVKRRDKGGAIMQRPLVITGPSGVGKNTRKREIDAARDLR
jgi:hypothetical protein